MEGGSGRAAAGQPPWGWVVPPPLLSQPPVWENHQVSFQSTAREPDFANTLRKRSFRLSHFLQRQPLLAQSLPSTFLMVPTVFLWTWFMVDVSKTSLHVLHLAWASVEPSSSSPLGLPSSGIIVGGLSPAVMVSSSEGMPPCGFDDFAIGFDLFAAAVLFFLTSFFTIFQELGGLR